MKHLIVLLVLFSLAACSPSTETAETAESSNKVNASVIEATETEHRTFIVMEKFEQDGRFFVSVKDQAGNAGHLVQAEIKDKTIWDEVTKGGAITFDKAWNVTGVDWVGIETILDERIEKLQAPD